MFEKLQKTEENFEEIAKKLTDPDVISDNDLYAKLMKEYKNLEPIVEKFRELKKAQNDADQAKELAEDSSLDEEMREMARMEYDEKKKYVIILQMI